MEACKSIEERPTHHSSNKSTLVYIAILCTGAQVYPCACQDRVVPLARSKDLQSLLRCDLQMMEAIIHSFPNGGHVYYFGGKMVIG